MSEGFADVAVMQLVEMGKLKLDDKISKYVPNIPKNWQHFTLKQLMAQSTGIPDYTKSQNFNPAYNEYTPRQLLNLVADKPLNFTIG